MTATASLFEGAGMLTWLPDETLFSLCSRHHYFSGRRLGSDTNTMLFGHRRGGAQHDLPSCIDEFVARTNGQYGAAGYVCSERTLLRYYRKFIDQSDEDRVVVMLRSGSVANLKFQMGILTSRFRANHPLKACVDCMEIDRHAVGWAYWHLEHQYPGVWVCPVHGRLLNESNLKANGVERFLWHLPDVAHFRTFDSELGADIAPTGTLFRISKLTVNLLRDETLGRLDVAQLHRLYRAELDGRNLLTAKGGFRLREIASQFEAHVRPLRQLSEFAALPATVDEAYHQLSRHLRTPRTGTHPLRHIVMIDWLVGDCERFLERYAQVVSKWQVHVSQGKHDELEPHLALLNGHKKEDLAALIQHHGSSVRAAAAELGIDTATAMAWAAQMGIQVSRRPKKLKHEIRESLITRLREGAEKAAVAIEFSISVETVTHVLRTEIGLHSAWKEVRFQHALNNARALWEGLTSSHAHLGIKLLRRMHPATYAWLYRNDRTWLVAQSPAHVTRTSKDSTSVRWDMRDVDLSAAVERVALALSLSLGTKKLMLWHLYQEIPELKAKLSSLSRLPLTVWAIERALDRRDLKGSQTPLDF